jgi:hypothetical protein
MKTAKSLGKNMLNAVLTVTKHGLAPAENGQAISNMTINNTKKMRLEQKFYKRLTRFLRCVIITLTSKLERLF